MTQKKRNDSYLEASVKALYNEYEKQADEHEVHEAYEWIKAIIAEADAEPPGGIRESFIKKLRSALKIIGAYSGFMAEVKCALEVEDEDPHMEIIPLKPEDEIPEYPAGVSKEEENE